MTLPRTIMLVLAAALLPSVQAANLLADPGFEAGEAIDEVPADGWYQAYGDANSRRVVQTGGAHSGDYCLRLEAPTIPQRDPAVSVEQVVAVRPGEAYALRFWARGEPTGVRGMMVIVWSSSDHSWLTASATEFPLTETWASHRVIALAPAEAAFGVARFDIRDPGSCWVDDAFFGPHEATDLSTRARDGVVAAGQGYAVELTALDVDGVPVPGAPITCALTTTGDGRLQGAGMPLIADEGGRAVVRARASSRPGVADSLTITAGSASLRITATTAEQGEVTSWAVAAPQRTVGPGAEIPVTLQLLGAFGEPARVAGRAARVSASSGGSVSPAEVSTDGEGRALVSLRAPEELFAAVKVTVSDAAGLSGASEAVIVAPPVRENAITVGPNGYFRRPDGRPFIPLGGLYANWVHKVDQGTAGDLVSQSFSDASDDQLRQWFAYLRDNGVTALRAMLRDHTAKGCEPLDIVGRVNPSLLGRWEHLMELARPYGIRFLVTLHESWYATYAAYHNVGALTACVLPYYTADELEALPAYRRRFLVEKRMLAQTTDALSDPDVMACQRDYLTDLIPRLRGNPDIFAYEIENEQPNGFFGWTAAQTRLVRELDPVTPICVSHLGTDAVAWADLPNLDFFTYHIYPGGANTSAEMDYGAAVAATARYARLGLPAFSGEAIGDDSGKATPEARHLAARDCIWAQLVAGNMGCFLWNTWDEEMKEFRLAKQITDELGIAQVRRARPRVGIDVTHPLTDDLFFQGIAGRAMYAAMGRAVRECGRLGVDFDFTFEPERYELAVKPDELEALRGLRPEIAVPEGYEAQYLLAQDGEALLCYLRNIAGTTTIQADPASGWTRRRAPRHVVVTVDVPLRATSLRVFDLDTGEVRTVPCERGVPVDLGTTDHDLVLLARGG